MRGAFQLARIFGIPVRIHWTFGLIVVCIFYLIFRQCSVDWKFLIWQTLFILILFTCVVLHEFGHALTARRYGVHTLDIILSPIGGVARLDRMPEKPIQEFWVAIAGPLVNFGIIALLLAFYYVYAPSEKFSLLLKMPKQFWYPQSNIFPVLFDYFDYLVISIMAINAILAFFNLLPAFPLDGGRIFRSLLSIKIGRLKATRVAAYLGQFIALAIVVLAFYRYDFILAFIGLFVFSTAENEYKSVKLEETLKQKTVRDFFTSNFKVFNLHTPLLNILESIQDKLGSTCLVIGPNNEILGSINQKLVKKQFDKAETPETLVLSPNHINSISNSTSPDESLKKAYFKLRRSNEKVIPVFDQGVLIGILETTTIEQFIFAKNERS